MDRIPVGTTVLATKYKDGVFIAGDRQAVEGFQVGERRIEKVFEADEYTAIAVAGVAAICIEMAKIFRIQLEFYEKSEGISLTLEGKANYLSNLISSNLTLAMQGLVVVPILAGYDTKRETGRIFKYDVAGGRYEEIDFYAIGSGGKDAQVSLKKLYRPNMNFDRTLEIVLEALWDAADEDLGTGGPDFLREIYPQVKVINEKGIEDISDSDIKEFYEKLIERLREERYSRSE
jgi:proteasome beta subunit